MYYFANYKNKTLLCIHVAIKSDRNYTSIPNNIKGTKLAVLYSKCMKNGLNTWNNDFQVFDKM